MAKSKATCTDPSLSSSSSRNVLFMPAYRLVFVSLLVFSRLQIIFKFASSSCLLSLCFPLSCLIFIGCTTEMSGLTKAPALYMTVGNCKQFFLTAITRSTPSFSSYIKHTITWVGFSGWSRWVAWAPIRLLVLVTCACQFLFLISSLIHSLVLIATLSLNTTAHYMDAMVSTTSLPFQTVLCKSSLHISRLTLAQSKWICLFILYSLNICTH